MTIPLSTLLGVLFVALKLTHVIAWSWIWVLAPFWIGYTLALIFLIFTLFLVVGASNTVVRSTRSRVRR